MTAALSYEDTCDYSSIVDLFFRYLSITNAAIRQLSILSTRLDAILVMKDAANIFSPLARSAATMRSVPPPVSPPKRSTLIGVPISGATTEIMSPVISAIL